MSAMAPFVSDLLTAPHARLSDAVAAERLRRDRHNDLPSVRRRGLLAIAAERRLRRQDPKAC